MTSIVVEIDDDLAKYLQIHAEERGVLLGDILSEMISEALSLSGQIDAALEIAGCDVSDLPQPIVAAVEIVVSAVQYHKKNERLLQADALTLWTLRKIDARRGDRTRDEFLADLMDRLDEIRKAP